MALPKFEKDISYISKLSDQPNDTVGGQLSAAQLKERFDAAGNDIKTFLNDVLIPAIASDIAAAAEGVGSGSAITGDRLADGAVTATKIAALAVLTEAIQDLAVTTAKLADGAVNSEKLADGAVIASKIASGAVGREAIAEEAISTNKLFSGAVTSEKIKDGAISKTKLADDAKSKGVAVTLASGGWSGNVQTVAVEDVTASNNIVIVAAPESRGAYNDAEIYCSAQGDRSLTFACGSAPSEDVVANVLILP